MRQTMRDLAKPLAFRRRFHAYGIGTPKSGTQSLARMFAENFRAMHEPRATQLLETLLGYGDGEITRADIRRFLGRRDRRLWLEIEATHPLHHVIDILVDLFPDSQYLLTVRDPYSWVASEVNQQIHTQDNQLWTRLEHLRYRPEDYAFTAGDRGLEQAGRFPLAAYLDYWTRHNEAILGHVPSERLLVIETRELNRSRETLAEFLRIDPALIDLSRSHSHARKQTYLDLWAVMDRAYVEYEVKARCGPLMERLIPHVGSIDDVIPA